MGGIAQEASLTASRSGKPNRRFEEYMVGRDDADYYEELSGKDLLGVVPEDLDDPGVRRDDVAERTSVGDDTAEPALGDVRRFIITRLCDHLRPIFLLQQTATALCVYLHPKALQYLLALLNDGPHQIKANQLAMLLRIDWSSRALPSVHPSKRLNPLQVKMHLEHVGPA